MLTSMRHLLFWCLAMQVENSFALQLDHSQPRVKKYDSSPCTEKIRLYQKGFHRRQTLELVASGLTVLWTNPGEARAGELAESITQAITQSELGKSVRRSVVRGSQFVDSVDEQWENFSDRFGLGAARKQQPPFPTKPTLDPLQPLDAVVATSFLSMADEAFSRLTLTSVTDLQKQIRRVRETVAPAFLRSGLNPTDVEENGLVMTAQQFNFLCYCHFKAFSDIIIGRKIDFGTFREQFEKLVGDQVVSLLMPPPTTGPGMNQPTKEQLPLIIKEAWGQLDRLSTVLVEKGFLARMDRSLPGSSGEETEDLLTDWAEDALSELQWNIALDGDITQNCQILLQEQSYLFYPNFARYAIQSILAALLRGQATLDVTDYYIDTDYNPDPSKFEVKEILVNIVLERRS